MECTYNLMHLTESVTIGYYTYLHWYHSSHILSYILNLQQFHYYILFQLQTWVILLWRFLNVLGMTHMDIRPQSFSYCIFNRLILSPLWMVFFHVDRGLLSTTVTIIMIFTNRWMIPVYPNSTELWPLVTSWNPLY